MIAKNRVSIAKHWQWYQIITAWIIITAASKVAWHQTALFHCLHPHTAWHEEQGKQSIKPLSGIWIPVIIWRKMNRGQGWSARHVQDPWLQSWTLSYIAKRRPRTSSSVFWITNIVLSLMKRSWEFQHWFTFFGLCRG